MPEELDYSFLPKPEPLPDGGVRMRLPDKAEWLSAGGIIKEEESTGHTGYRIVEDWRDKLNKWLTAWQEKTGNRGKAPVAFNRAWEVLSRTEELGMWVSFLSEDDMVDSIKGSYPGITSGEIDLVSKFIKPMLEEKPWSLKVTKMLHPSEVKEEEEG